MAVRKVGSKRVRVRKRPKSAPIRARKLPRKPRQQLTAALAPQPFTVGIGASAGGLAALETFFQNMPSTNGMAFVVVTHQHPKHDSLLPELLSRSTRMPVAFARDKALLEADHVYVSVPGKQLAVLNRELQLMDALPGPDLHLPIDYFFRSLAHDQAEHAICVVLSGAGTDGTLGLRAIKGNSGLAIAQDEQSAQYTGMPLSANATTLVDYVLTPEQMAGQLLAYTRTSPRLTTVADSDALESQVETVLPKLFILLRNRVGHDFSDYKLTTILRRVARRMRLHQIVQPLDYIHLLQADPNELDLLFQELLISVTQFFRDPGGFEALALRIAECIDAQADPVELRVWVPGCSTGEEAYSIAMLAIELAERARKRLQLLMFATDIDPKAIETARAGLYPNGIAADVGVARLRRFFVGEANGYRIVQQVRGSIVFATHNILRDPPFTRLTLLSCRNLLIYLNPDVQRRLLPLFHYALLPGGSLWLGPAETATGHAGLFAAVDRKWKIYERRKTRPGTVQEFDVQLAPKSQESGSRANPVPRETRARLKREATERSHKRPTLSKTAAATAALQTSNEQLKSANEELQSANEELQSTNEELETTKEEFQSLNEELQTVNSELQSKIDELAHVNDDMYNLLNSIDIATLFLDRELRIKRFTDQARRIVRVIATDLGRPIGDLVPQIRYETLTQDANEVLRTLRPHEAEVQGLDGRWLFVRILPYRTALNVIDGVVITFVDIDRLKRAETLAASREFAESIVQTVREPLVVLDETLAIVSTNRAFSRLLGLENVELEGRSLLEIAGGVFAVPRLHALLIAVIARGQPIEAFELTYNVGAPTPERIELNARRLEQVSAGPGRALVALLPSSTPQKPALP